MISNAAFLPIRASASRFVSISPSKSSIVIEFRRLMLLTTTEQQFYSLANSMGADRETDHSHWNDPL
jgi:hypothetical protein